MLLLEAQKYLGLLKPTGESSFRETWMRGSEGGRWKSALVVTRWRPTLLGIS